MKRNTWFRAYSEALDDPKVQRLHPTLFKAWFNLLCLASQHDGVLPSNDDIAFRLRVSVQDAQGYIDELILVGLIDIRADGSRTPHNWETRQFVSDTSTERVRKHRKQKNKTSGNGDETFHETPPEQSRAETEQSRAEQQPREQDAARESCSSEFEGLNGTADALVSFIGKHTNTTPDESRRMLLGNIRTIGEKPLMDAFTTTQAKMATGIIATPYQYLLKTAMSIRDNPPPKPQQAKASRSGGLNLAGLSADQRARIERRMQESGHA